MPLYRGSSVWYDDVSIGQPELRQIAQAPKDAAVAQNVAHWLARAQQGDDLYFSAYVQARDTAVPERLVGQILLHDIDPETGEALVGYHLFWPEDRGKGIGTKALAALQQYVLGFTTLRRLVIITSDDNLASQRIAQKRGFSYIGTSREDPVHGRCFVWQCVR